MNPAGLIIVGLCVVLMLIVWGVSLLLFYFISSMYRIKIAEITYMPIGDENEIPSY